MSPVSAARVVSTTGAGEVRSRTVGNGAPPTANQPAAVLGDLQGVLLSFKAAAPSWLPVVGRERSPGRLCERGAPRVGVLEEAGVLHQHGEVLRLQGAHHEEPCGLERPQVGGHEGRPAGLADRASEIARVTSKGASAVRLLAAAITLCAAPAAPVSPALVERCARGAARASQPSTQLPRLDSRFRHTGSSCHVSHSYCRRSATNDPRSEKTGGGGYELLREHRIQPCAQSPDG